MKKEGYVTCSNEDNDITYVFAFSANPDCKWVTVSSELYGDGNSAAETDTARIAKMLGTICINTVVIDSECALMRMYDKQGKPVDTLVIGQAEDYLENTEAKPNKTLWESLLRKETTWEEFTQMHQKCYAFAEEGLQSLASCLYMDKDLITFDLNRLCDFDGSIVTISFKKAAQTEKKISLQNGFVSAYGDLLEQNGFVLLKSKYPYFVRIIDGQMIQSISFAKEKAPDSEHEGFTVCVGLNLLSTPLTDFDQNPMTLDNQASMIPMASFLHSCKLYLEDYADIIVQTSFFYKKGCSGELLDALQTSQRNLLPLILAFFERYRTLESLCSLNHSLVPYYRDVVILTGSVDAYLAEREKEFPRQFEELVSVMANNPMMRPLFERKKKEALDSFEKEKQWFSDRKPEGKEYQEYMQNANDSKNDNLKKLSNFGFTF